MQTLYASEEEVEDVKILLRLLPLLVSLGLVILAVDNNGQFTLHVIKATPQFQTCLMNMKMLTFDLAVMCLIPGNQIFIYPIFNKYLPSMLKRIGAGLVLVFASLMINFTLDTVGHLQSNVYNTLYV